MGGQPLLSVVQWLVVLDLVLVDDQYARKTAQGSRFLNSVVPRGLEWADGRGSEEEECSWWSGQCEDASRSRRGRVWTMGRIVAVGVDLRLARRTTVWVRDWVPDGGHVGHQRDVSMLGAHSCVRLGLSYTQLGKPYPLD